MAAIDLFELAAEYLFACVTAINGVPPGGSTLPPPAAGAVPGGPIARYFVSPGPPPWDGEQIAVHIGSAVIADTQPLQPPLQPLHREGVTGTLNLVPLTCTIIRPAPVPLETEQGIVLPAPDLISTVAVQTCSDLWAIWSYVGSVKRSGALFPAPFGGDPRTREFIWDPAVALNQQGGYAGWQIQCRVRLDGYGAL